MREPAWKEKETTNDRSGNENKEQHSGKNKENEEYFKSNREDNLDGGKANVKGRNKKEHGGGS